MNGRVGILKCGKVSEQINVQCVLTLIYCILINQFARHLILLFLIYLPTHNINISISHYYPAIRDFTYMLRQTYPDRFTVTSPELVIPIASGDYPHVIANKIPHTNGVAPVLMFGSTFRDMNIYPNMVAMPMPPPEHMGCFVHWVQNNGNGHVCKQWMPGTPDASSNGGGTLVFGEEYGLEYDDLIVSKK